MDIEPDWVHLGYTENGIAVNSYFVEHPEMVLGHMEYDTRIYGQDSRYTVCVNDDENFNMYEELNRANARRMKMAQIFVSEWKIHMKPLFPKVILQQFRDC